MVTVGLRITCIIVLLVELVGCASESIKPVRLYVFHCGTIDVKDVSVFHPGIGKGEHKILTDSCYLIVHPKGSLMWDTGISDELAKLPEGKTMYEVFTFRMTQPLAVQFQEIGVSPASVQFLGISHLHSDHVGNANLFPQAQLLIQKEEYAAGFGPEPAKFGFDPSSYPTLKNNPVKQLEGDYDVFGDGKVVIKRMLGHTPGHQALFVKLAKSGNILLSGDMVHFTDNWVHKYVPGFNFDKQQSLKTMQAAEKFLTDNNARLWIQHDLEQNNTLKHVPEYYE
ncbi:MAG: N-acyl homoserine lactonase family protein [Gammaproteobacteria bacterium]|nr:N-acyl homoserine lactonase family protein [Gammaproteobacteria bacterium]